MIDYKFEMDGLVKGLLEQDCMVHNREAVNAVIMSYQAMKHDQQKVEEVYKPKGEWESYIKLREVYYKTLQSGNIYESEKVLSNFWRNALSAIVKQYTTFD